jgi:hypothetical protein
MSYERDIVRKIDIIEKKKLVDTLITCGIIRLKYTGKVLLSFTDGGINYIERTETLK